MPYQTWQVFAPYHYLTRELNRSAHCFGLAIDQQVVAFAGILHRPNSRGPNNLKGVSRLVTLPDWQGLGLAMMLVDELGAAYKARGFHLHTYPAHPGLIRTFQKSPTWRQTMQSTKNLGNPSSGGNSSIRYGGFGGRPNAVFDYVGPSMPVSAADRLIGATT